MTKILSFHGTQAAGLERMANDVLPKPQLHVSMLTTLSNCGIQFERRYINNEVVPPSVSLLVGKSTHRAVEMNLKHKAETGEMLGYAVVSDIARDALQNEWDAQGVALQPDEASQGLAQVKGDAVDMATTLARLHREQVAPNITPKSADHVERKFVLEMPSEPMDLAGTIDIDEGDTIRDTKTSRKSPPKDAADASLQLTAYAAAKKVIDGVFPKKLSLDYLVRTKEAKVVTLDTERGAVDMEFFLARFKQAQRIIQAGAFSPANPDHWVCSQKFCGYWSTCPFAARRKAFAVAE